MISNRSDVIVNYSWKAYATEMEEQQKRTAYVSFS